MVSGPRVNIGQSTYNTPFDLQKNKRKSSGDVKATFQGSSAQKGFRGYILRSQVWPLSADLNQATLTISIQLTHIDRCSLHDYLTRNT